MKSAKQHPRRSKRRPVRRPTRADEAAFKLLFSPLRSNAPKPVNAPEESGANVNQAHENGDAAR